MEPDSCSWWIWHISRVQTSVGVGKCGPFQPVVARRKLERKYPPHFPLASVPLSVSVSLGEESREAHGHNL